MDPTFFATPASFRLWLQKHHAAASELWVGFHKRHTGKPSITWPESVDEALCFGWIDGIRKSIDADAYAIRFTPRKRSSTWSAVNTRRAEALIREGRMAPAGIAAFSARDPVRSGIYSFEQRQSATLTATEEAHFRRQRKAWVFWEGQPPSYRKTAVWWVVSAKRAETRERRFSQLIADSAAGLRIAPLRVGRKAR